MSGIPFNLFTLLFMKSLPTNLVLIDLARQAGQQAPWHPPVATSPALGLLLQATLPGFFVGAGDLNLGLLACILSTSLSYLVFLFLSGNKGTTLLFLPGGSGGVSDVIYVSYGS